MYVRSECNGFGSAGEAGEGCCCILKVKNSSVVISCIIHALEVGIIIQHMCLCLIAVVIHQSCGNAKPLSAVKSADFNLSAVYLLKAGL